MPQLQMPLQIWLEATPDERDSYWLSAGFDPNLPIRDNGTDTSFVRFIQDAPIPTVVGTAFPTAEFVVAAGLPQSGDDTRDYAPVSVLDEESMVNGQGAIGAASAGVGVSVAGRALRLIMGGGGGRLTAAIWNSLPSLVRTALTQIGIGVGALIAFSGDIPFIELPGQGDKTLVPFDASQEGVDIQILPTQQNPLAQVQVVGSWVANGVTFYRLADGKLAVQNKRGRWKVWRPKKPIVLYSDGASNLKTMLRADKALNKQAKKIAAMLNRRAPRTRKTSQKPGIIIESGPGNVITR